MLPVVSATPAHLELPGAFSSLSHGAVGPPVKSAPRPHKRRLFIGRLHASMFRRLKPRPSPSGFHELSHCCARWAILPGCKEHLGSKRATRVFGQRRCRARNVPDSKHCGSSDLGNYNRSLLSEREIKPKKTGAACNTPYVSFALGISMLR